MVDNVQMVVKLCGLMHSYSFVLSMIRCISAVLYVLFLNGPVVLNGLSVNVH